MSASPQLRTYHCDAAKRRFGPGGDLGKYRHCYEFMSDERASHRFARYLPPSRAQYWTIYQVTAVGPNRLPNLKLSLAVT